MIPKFVKLSCAYMFNPIRISSLDFKISLTYCLDPEFSCTIKSGKNFNRSATVLENMEGGGGRGGRGGRLLSFKYLVYKILKMCESPASPR